MTTKYLIVHADDFGMSPGISRGIIHTIRKGIVTSTSILLRRLYISDTRKLVKKNLDIDWGLHVKIEGNKNKKIADKDVVSETEKQVALFIKYFKITPSHIDYHGGFKFTKKKYFQARMLARKHKLAFRYDNQHQVDTRFYGLHNKKPTNKKISIESLLNILKSVEFGTTELVCHPGWTSNRLADSYRLQRNREIETLTSNKVKKLVKRRNIDLINFRQYTRYEAKR